jgi:hypothetical protein
MKAIHQARPEYQGDLMTRPAPPKDPSRRRGRGRDPPPIWCKTRCVEQPPVGRAMPVLSQGDVAGFLPLTESPRFFSAARSKLTDHIDAHMRGGGEERTGACCKRRSRRRRVPRKRRGRGTGGEELDVVSRRGHVRERAGVHRGLPHAVAGGKRGPKRQRRKRMCPKAVAVGPAYCRV